MDNAREWGVVGTVLTTRRHLFVQRVQPTYGFSSDNIGILEDAVDAARAKSSIDQAAPFEDQSYDNRRKRDGRNLFVIKKEYERDAEPMKMDPVHTHFSTSLTKEGIVKLDSLFSYKVSATKNVGTSSRWDCKARAPSHKEKNVYVEEVSRGETGNNCGKNSYSYKRKHRTKSSSRDYKISYHDRHRNKRRTESYCKERKTSDVHHRDTRRRAEDSKTFQTRENYSKANNSDRKRTTLKNHRSKHAEKQPFRHHKSDNSLKTNKKIHVETRLTPGDSHHKSSSSRGTNKNILVETRLTSKRPVSETREKNCINCNKVIVPLNDVEKVTSDLLESLNKTKVHYCETFDIDANVDVKISGKKISQSEVDFSNAPPPSQGMKCKIAETINSIEMREIDCKRVCGCTVRNENVADFAHCSKDISLQDIFDIVPLSEEIPVISPAVSYCINREKSVIPVSDETPVVLPAVSHCINPEEFDIPVSEETPPTVYPAVSTSVSHCINPEEFDIPVSEETPPTVYPAVSPAVSHCINPEEFDIPVSEETPAVLLAVSYCIDPEEFYVPVSKKKHTVSSAVPHAVSYCINPKEFDIPLSEESPAVLSSVSYCIDPKEFDIPLSEESPAVLSSVSYCIDPKEFDIPLSEESPAVLSSVSYCIDPKEFDIPLSEESPAVLSSVSYCIDPKEFDIPVSEETPAVSLAVPKDCINPEEFDFPTYSSLNNDYKNYYDNINFQRKLFEEEIVKKSKDYVIDIKTLDEQICLKKAEVKKYTEDFDIVGLSKDLMSIKENCLSNNMYQNIEKMYNSEKTNLIGRTANITVIISSRDKAPSDDCTTTSSSEASTSMCSRASMFSPNCVTHTKLEERPVRHNVLLYPQTRDRNHDSTSKSAAAAAAAAASYFAVENSVHANLFKKKDLNVSLSANVLQKFEPQFNVDRKLSALKLRKEFVLNWIDKCQNHFLHRSPEKSIDKYDPGLNSSQLKFPQHKHQADSSHPCNALRRDAEVAPDLSHPCNAMWRAANVTPWQQKTSRDKVWHKSDKVLTNINPVPYILPCPLISTPHKTKSQNQLLAKVKEVKPKKSPRKSNLAVKSNVSTNHKIAKQNKKNALLSFGNKALREQLSKFKIPKLSSQNKIGNNSVDNRIKIQAVSDCSNANLTDCSLKCTSKSGVRLSDDVLNSVTKQSVSKRVQTCIQQNANKCQAVGVKTRKTNVKENVKIKSDAELKSSNSKRKFKSKEICSKKMKLDSIYEIIKISNTKKQNKSEQKNASEITNQCSLTTKFQKQISQLDSKLMSLFDFLSQIHFANIPEYLINLSCIHFETSLDVLLNLNKKVKLLTVSRDKQTYNMNTDLQRQLEQNFRYKENSTENNVMVFHNIFTDHVNFDVPPYSAFIVDMCEHLMQLWRHVFQYPQVLSNNIEGIFVIVDTLHQHYMNEEVSTLVKCLLQLADDTQFQSNDIKLIVKLNCCKFNLLSIEESETLIHSVMNETCDSKIKTQALMVQLSLLNTRKLYDRMWSIFDEIVNVSKNADRTRVKLMKAEVLHARGQTCEALVLLKQIISDKEVESVERVKSSVLIAMISDQSEDIKSGLASLQSHILYLKNNLKPLHPVLLDFCHQEAKIIFRLENRKVEAFLLLWKIYTWQCKMFGHEHCVARETKITLELMCSHDKSLKPNISSHVQV